MQNRFHNYFILLFSTMFIFEYIMPLYSQYLSSLTGYIWNTAEVGIKYQFINRYISSILSEHCFVKIVVVYSWIDIYYHVWACNIISRLWLDIKALDYLYRVYILEINPWTIHFGCLKVHTRLYDIFICLKYVKFHGDHLNNSV